MSSRKAYKASHLAYVNFEIHNTNSNFSNGKYISLFSFIFNFCNDNIYNRSHVYRITYRIHVEIDLREENGRELPVNLH